MRNFFKSLISIFKRKRRYQGAIYQIQAWLDEPGDYDVKTWPEIEKYLYPPISTTKRKHDSRI